jgi:hypothetical protein
MERASAVVVPVRNGSSASGWAATPRSRARSVCCCIRFAPVLHHCGFARLEPQRTSACLYPARAAPTPRRAPAASRRFATHHGRDPLPGAACALAPLVGRAARSQCAHGNFWASSDQVIRLPSRLCHLTRFRSGLTSRFPADRLSLLEQAGFSERFFMASFPGWVSLLPLFCLVCSPSHQFGWIFRTSLPGSA